MQQTLKEVLQDKFRSVTTCNNFYLNREDVSIGDIYAVFVEGTNFTDYEEDSGKENFVVYEFNRGEETVLVKFIGTYWSYDGNKFEEWMFVKAQPVSTIQYVKE